MKIFLRVVFSLLIALDTSYPQKTAESDSHFKKWLNEDVVYIITPEERNVFLKLTTDEEMVFPFTPFKNEYEFSGDRLLVHKTIPFDGLKPGNYTVLFRITDLMNNRTLEPRVSFSIK
jgi:hypothetical protein